MILLGKFCVITHCFKRCVPESSGQVNVHSQFIGCLDSTVVIVFTRFRRDTFVNGAENCSLCSLFHSKRNAEMKLFCYVMHPSFLETNSETFQLGIVTPTCMFSDLVLNKGKKTLSTNMLYLTLSIYLNDSQF